MGNIAKYNGLAIASVKKRNGLSISSVKKINGLTVPAGFSPLGDANFDFTTTGGGSETWTGNQLVLGRPNTSCVCYELCTSTQNSNIIFAQCNLTRQSDSSTEDLAGMCITSGSSIPNGSRPNYSATISTRESTGGQYRLHTVSTSAQYDTDSNINKGKDIKITYNTANNEIKFWYWNVSSWTQMGTTQTLNIIQGSTIKLIIYYNNIQTSLGTLTFDKIYFGNVTSDYTTQYPA